MKTKIVILSLTLLTAICFARPIKIPSYKELFEKSDLVAILSIERIEISKEVSANNPSPKKYQDYLAYCKIEHILKGKTDAKSIVIPFFQDPSGAPGFNGAMPAPFTQKKMMIHYLAYLKHANGNNWLPADKNLLSRTSGQHVCCVT